jgi:predicted  nucleic acid-binding Zn-ribbon protein
MRYLALLVMLSLPAFAQKAEADQAVLQKLLVEVQQLRAAIERSTLLGARTQLALTRLQMQEAAATRASQQLNDVRQQGFDIVHRREQDASRLKDWEDKLPGITNADMRRDIDSAIKNTKAELDELATREQVRAARESELANEFQAAQNELAATRARISDMERSLDAAIQQLLKPQ